jgi:hypothetical protein
MDNSDYSAKLTNVKISQVKKVTSTANINYV